MSKDERIYTKRQLESKIEEIHARLHGEYSYDRDSDFYRKVMAAIGNDPLFLVDEIVTDAIKAVIDKKSKVTFLESQLKLDIGYGEKVIKLPEKRAVKVADANLSHMEIQRQLLLDNFLKQAAAFTAHHDKIVMPIINAMMTHGFKTAGEALEFLCGQ